MADERLYKPISEVADELKIPTHVIRFWETKFSIITPIKRAGGRRFYSSEDIFILKKIKDLLYNHSYSIKSVQKAIDSGHFKEILKQELPSLDVVNENVKEVVVAVPSFDVEALIQELEEIKQDLIRLV
ncbi:MAG: MerR family regulatory protein [Alphaproteobacteria bacterium ADurb.Bin438]|nr:MAG: MerR family regulatory protein [Alphaproteobacteria bacterium ADurb.Bin438]